MYIVATFYAIIIYVTSAYIQVFGTRSSEGALALLATFHLLICLAVALGHVLAFFIVFPMFTVIQAAFAGLVLNTRLRREMQGVTQFDPVVDERSPLGRV